MMIATVGEVVIPQLNLPNDTAEVDLDEQYLLVMRRDFGGLCYPNKEVIKICTILETHVRFWNSKGLQNMKKRKVIESSLRECQTRRLTDAMKCEEGDTDHGVEFVRNIMNIYLEARLHHLARESTATVVPTTNRNSNKKGTHFAGN
ncbi:unnamed protein product [Orchesella dallaii]|uniref:Uncharacterized protein n=1 Tax=Orchesella dallaii TaxID=48710 RepID=A0ABP1R2R9_9HEXA